MNLELTSRGAAHPAHDDVDRRSPDRTHSDGWQNAWESQAAPTPRSPSRVHELRDTNGRAASDPRPSSSSSFRPRRVGVAGLTRGHGAAKQAKKVSQLGKRARNMRGNQPAQVVARDGESGTLTQPRWRN